jgi:hypothetical protein
MKKYHINTVFLSHDELGECAYFLGSVGGEIHMMKARNINQNCPDIISLGQININFDSEQYSTYKNGIISINNGENIYQFDTKNESWI